MTRVTAVSLAKDIDRFLVFKRALGHPYQRGEAALPESSAIRCSQPRPEHDD